MLELFGQLARDRGFAVSAEDLGGGLQRFEQAMRRLEENHGSALAQQLFKQRSPFAVFSRHETLEGEAVGRQARDRERAQYRRRAGHNRYVYSGFGTGANQVEPRVADGRHACVTNHQQIVVTSHFDQLLETLAFVVVVQAERSGVYLDPEGLSQLEQGAGVFCGDELRANQVLNQSRRGVGKVSDWGRGEN